MSENSFPLEKILNISVEEYCEYAGRTLRGNYNLKGVHLIEKFTGKGCSYEGKKAIEVFADMVPKKAEIVVNYRESLVFNNNKDNSEAVVTISMHGTALIPEYHQ